MKWSSAEKKKFWVFMAVAFGMPVFMGVFMGISFYRGSDVSVFPIVQMFYPAAGVMLAELLVREKGDNSGRKLPIKFFIGYLIITAVLVLMTIGSVIWPSAAWNPYAQYMIMAGSIVAWILYLLEKKEIKKGSRLSSWGKRKSRPLLYVLLFLALYGFRNFVAFATGGQSGEFLAIFAEPATYSLLLILILNFFLTWLMFFGEEYGWRSFLQPMLQKRFGLKAGVLLLGVLWGLWHLPINLFYYSPQTWLQSVLSQQITCISLAVFFGFAYQKTRNTWVPVIMHFLNNNLILLFAGTGEVSNQVIGWKDVGLLLIVNAVLFMPVLLSKSYKADMKCSESSAEMENIWK